MGQCCIPASLQVAPEVYAGSDGLPDGIVQVTEASDKALIDEFISVLAESWCGSPTRPPEPCFSWCFDPTSSGENLGDVLKSDVTESRKKYFDFFLGFMAYGAFRHGGCFGLKGPDGNLVTAAITYPPNKKHLHQLGLFEQMNVAEKMGGFSKVSTPEVTGGDPAARQAKLDKAMNKAHKVHAKGEHLYLQAIGTATGHDGKGYGRQLMTFLLEAANRMNVPVYVDCCGKKNERFYEKNGFKVVQRYPIECKGQALKVDGVEGFYSMLWQK
eukprot:g10397.t1